MYYGVSFGSLPRCSWFGRYRQKHGWDHGEWVADNNRLVFIISGRAAFRIQNQKYQVSPGDWLLIPCGSRYSAWTEEICEYYFFHFSEPLEALAEKPAAAFEIRTNYSLSPGERPSETVYLTEKMASGEDLPQLLHISGEMHRLMLRSGAGERLLFDLYFGQVLLLLSIRVSGLLDSDTPALMKQAVAYIQEHYTSPLTLTELCGRLHTSKSYLLRLFRRHLGMTVTEYINGVKLDYGAQLLRTSTMNVSQTAEYLGYADSGYFARLFRKRFGVPPSRFARSGNEGENGCL